MLPLSRPGYAVSTPSQRSVCDVSQRSSAFASASSRSTSPLAMARSARPPSNGTRTRSSPLIVRAVSRVGRRADGAEEIDARAGEQVGVDLGLDREVGAMALEVDGGALDPRELTPAEHPAGDAR